MNTIDTLLLIVTGIVAIWGIYQTYVTKRLEQQIYRLNTGLDQSLQILHRAREAVFKIHNAYVFLLQYREFQEKPDDAYKKALAEKSAYEAELKGIALAIGDKELLDLVNEGYKAMKVPDDKRSLMRDELEIRGQLQQFHTRISQLIEATTKKQ